MYYEDFEISKILTTPTRTIDAAGVDEFVRLFDLDKPMFTSTEAARALGHADRLIPAPMLLTTAMSLANKAGIFDHVVAVLQFDELRFHQSVHPGETFVLEASACEKRGTSRPDRGIVILNYELKAQDGRTIMTTRATYMMLRRDEA